MSLQIRGLRSSVRVRSNRPCSSVANHAFRKASSRRMDTSVAKAAMSMPGDQEFKPFSRLRERDPYRLLGIGKDAAFEEVKDAKNFLIQEYKWHEPSKEAIEMAFESIMQEDLKLRNKFGFRPPRTGKRGDAPIGPPPKSLLKQATDIFDPSVTRLTLVNEGAAFAIFAAWALFSADNSFPLAGTFAYSVYKFQTKRLKRTPDGPFLAGNPIVGAILSTVILLALSCLAMALVTTALAPFVSGNMRQIGSCMVVVLVGVMNTYMK